MDYNTQREKLIIPEYGRNVQKMVNICLRIQDRDRRNEYANKIIQTMKNVNPVGKDSPNYKQKLWDHLFIISGYKLDVDSPYPKPIREEQEGKPQPLQYKFSQITYRPYGSYIEAMLKKIATLPEGKDKEILSEQTAQEMKKLFLQWNINTCDDEVLRAHFEFLSDHQLKLPEDFKFKATKLIMAQNNIQKPDNKKQQPSKKKKKKQAKK